MQTFFWDQKKTVRGQNGEEKTNQTKKSRKKSFSKVYCINSNYAFTLERPIEPASQKDSSPWLVSNLMTVPEQIARFDKEYFEDDFSSARDVLVSVNKKPLKELIERVGFKVGMCQVIHQSGEDLVEVEFDFPNQRTEEDYAIQGGKLVLDPRRYWVVRSYEARLNVVKSQGKCAGTNELVVDTQGAMPVPKRAVIETIARDGKVVWEFKYDLKILEKMPSDEEFTLSAFGLKEPTGIKKGTPWFLWLAIVGIVCISLGILIRRFKLGSRGKTT